MKPFITTFLLLLACGIMNSRAQDAPPDPIPIIIKTSGSGTNGGNANNQLPVSAMYDATTLTVSFTGSFCYTTVTITEELTETVVESESAFVTATHPDIDIDITDLPVGRYVLDIYLQNGDIYEGVFTIRDNCSMVYDIFPDNND